MEDYRFKDDYIPPKKVGLVQTKATDHPLYRMLHAAKSRAKKKGVPFDLTLQDLDDVWNECCPILGIPLVRGEGIGGIQDNSPSLDKIDPELGYVKGNIAIISVRANRIKQNATVEEIEKVYLWLQQFN